MSRSEVEDGEVVAAEVAVENAVEVVGKGTTKKLSVNVLWRCGVAQSGTRGMRMNDCAMNENDEETKQWEQQRHQQRQETVNRGHEDHVREEASNPNNEALYARQFEG